MNEEQIRQAYRGTLYHQLSALNLDIRRCFVDIFAALLTVLPPNRYVSSASWKAAAHERVERDAKALKEEEDAFVKGDK